MRVRVILLGADAEDQLQQAADDYLRRAGRRQDAGIVPLEPERRGKGADDARVRALEGEALLAASEGTTRVALDVKGRALTSEAFAKTLEDLLQRGRPVSFLIGGATGLHESVRDGSDLSISLSPMTYAHRLALVVLAEQVYRAAEIARGGPYHK